MFVCLGVAIDYLCQPFEFSSSASPLLLKYVVLNSALHLLLS